MLFKNHRVNFAILVLASISLGVASQTNAQEPDLSQMAEKISKFAGYCAVVNKALLERREAQIKSTQTVSRARDVQVAKISKIAIDVANSANTFISQLTDEQRDEIKAIYVRNDLGEIEKKKLLAELSQNLASSAKAAGAHSVGSVLGQLNCTGVSQITLALQVNFQGSQLELVACKGTIGISRNLVSLDFTTVDPAKLIQNAVDQEEKSGRIQKIDLPPDELHYLMANLPPDCLGQPSREETKLKQEKEAAEKAAAAQKAQQIADEILRQQIEAKKLADEAAARAQLEHNCKVQIQSNAGLPRDQLVATTTEPCQPFLPVPPPAILPAPESRVGSYWCDLNETTGCSTAKKTVSGKLGGGGLITPNGAGLAARVSLVVDANASNRRIKAGSNDSSRNGPPFPGFLRMEGSVGGILANNGSGSTVVPIGSLGAEEFYGISDELTLVSGNPEGLKLTPRLLDVDYFGLPGVLPLFGAPDALLGMGVRSHDWTTQSSVHFIPAGLLADRNPKTGQLGNNQTYTAVALDFRQNLLNDHLTLSARAKGAITWADRDVRSYSTDSNGGPEATYHQNGAGLFGRAEAAIGYQATPGLRFELNGMATDRLAKGILADGSTKNMNAQDSELGLSVFGAF